MNSTQDILSNEKTRVELPSTTTLYPSGTTQPTQLKPIVVDNNGQMSLGEIPQPVNSIRLTLAQAQALRSAGTVKPGVLYVVTFPGGRFGIDVAVEAFTTNGFSDQGTLVVTNPGIPSSSVVIDWSAGSYKALVADGSIYPTSTHQVPTTSAVGQAIIGKADLVGGLVPASELPIDQDLSSNSQTRVPSVKAVAAAISGFTAGDTISGFTNDVGKLTITTDKGNYVADLNTESPGQLLGNQLLADPEFNQVANTPGGWSVTYGWNISGGVATATDSEYLYQDIVVPVTGTYELTLKANTYVRGRIDILVIPTDGSGTPSIFSTGSFRYVIDLTAGNFRFHLLGRDYYYGSLEYCRLQQIKPGKSYGDNRFVRQIGSETIRGNKTFNNDIILGVGAALASMDKMVNLRGQLRVDDTGGRDVLYFKGGPGGGGSTASIAFDATGAAFGQNVSARYSFVDDGAFGAHHVWETKVNFGFDLITQAVMILTRNGQLGIGTLAPTEKLEVAGTVKADNVKAVNDFLIGNNRKVISREGGNDITFGYYNGIGTIRTVGTDFKWIDTNTQSEGMSLDKDGNLTLRGNVTAQKFIGDGSQLTNLPSLHQRSLSITTVQNDGEQVLNVSVPITGVGTIRVLETKSDGNTATRTIWDGFIEFNTLDQTITIYEDAGIKAGDKISGYFFY